VTLLIAALSLPVMVDHLRRARGRRRARRDPRALVAWLWRDALRWVRVIGVDARPNDTPLEVAARTSAVMPGASSELVALAQLVTAACYDANGPAPDDLAAARWGVELIERRAKAQLGRRWRVRYYLAQVKGVVAIHAGSTNSSAAQPSSIS
jgi:hypothetical protein